VLRSLNPKPWMRSVPTVLVRGGLTERPVLMCTVRVQYSQLVVAPLGTLAKKLQDNTQHSESRVG
jgi:hypothetical protein